MKSQLDKKICLVCSPGGHFLELYLLKSFWGKYDRFWITFQSADTQDLLKNEKVYWCQPVSRNPLKYLKALIRSLFILRRETPDLVLTMGANIGAVFVHAAFFLRIKSVFIELTARVIDLSLSARLSRPFANHLLIQWEEMKRFLAGVEYKGKVL